MGKRRRTSSSSATSEVKELFVAKYGSVHEMSRSLERGVHQKGFEAVSHETSKDRTRFSGTESYEQADEFLRLGDSESAKKIREFEGAVKVKASGNAYRIRQRNDVCGFIPHVPNMLLGLPQSMITQTRVNVKQKVITVVYNTSAAWNIPASDIQRANAALTSAIMGIEKRGVRVNLYVGTLCREEGQGVSMLCKVKDSSQYIDKLKMAYPLVNPSLLRRHMLRLIETTEGLNARAWSDGYGYPVKERGVAIKMLKDSGVEFDAYLGYYDIEHLDAEGIIKMINAA